MECIYSFRGFFPSRLRDVEVVAFENKTIRHALGDEVTKSILEEIEKDGRLRIVSPQQAKLRIEGEILFYEREPYEYDEQGMIISYKITIRARVGFYDKEKEAYYLPPKIYEGWSLYRVDEEKEEDGIERASRDLSQKALRALFLKEF